MWNRISQWWPTCHSTFCKPTKAIYHSDEACLDDVLLCNSLVTVCMFVSKNCYLFALYNFIDFKKWMFEWLKKNFSTFVGKLYHTCRQIFVQLWVNYKTLEGVGISSEFTSRAVSLMCVITMTQLFLHIYVCKRICMYVHIYLCMYVCMYVCMHVFMYVCTYIQMCVRTFVCNYVCLYVCMYIRMYMFTYVCTYVRTYVWMYVCMYRYKYKYANVCMYVTMYICTCM